MSSNDEPADARDRDIDGKLSKVGTMRCATPIRLGGVSALLWVGLLLAPAARADRFPPDPVEELRQALRQDKGVGLRPGEADKVLQYRKETLDKRVAALKTIGELSRALLLQDWRDIGLDPNVEKIDLDARTKVADRMEEAIRNVLEKGDATARIAVAGFVGELAVTVRNTEVKSPLVRTRLAALAGPLAKVAEEAKDPAVVAAAAQALGRINPEPSFAVKALAPLLASKDAVSRRAGADALSSLVRELAQAKKKPKPEPSARADVIKAIQAVAPVAGRGLADPDVEVRRASLAALYEAAVALDDLIPDFKPQEYPPPGRPLTADEKARIEGDRKLLLADQAELAPIFKALAEQAPALARVLRDPDADLRVQAGRTLERLGSNLVKLNRYVGTVPDLGREVSVLPGLGGAAAEVLTAEYAPPVKRTDEMAAALRKVVLALAAALTDPNVAVRLAAVDALEMLEEDAIPAAPALTAALNDKDRFVRWAAARVLGKLGPVDNANPVPGFIRLLGDPDLDVKLAATVALGHYGPLAKDAVPALGQTAVSTNDAEFRLAAIHTLESIGTDAAPAIPGLARGLSAPDPRIRKACADALGRFGPLARGAVDDLRRTVDDSDPDVRRAASEALLSILPAPANK